MESWETKQMCVDGETCKNQTIQKDGYKPLFKFMIHIIIQ